MYRSSPPEVFLGISVLKIHSKFIGEHPCRSPISVKLQSNFIEIALWHGCSPIRTPFPNNTIHLISFGGLINKNVRAI